MSIDPAAVQAVIDAWRVPSERVVQAQVRENWPALAAALDRLCAQDNGAPSRMLTSRELAEITDRYRVSPWDSPPGTV